MKFFKKLLGFGGKNSKKENVKKRPKIKKKRTFAPEYIEKDEKSNNWMIESIIQYTNSPEYRNEYMDFVEINCINFHDTEENTHEQWQIHQDYIKMIEKKLEELIGNLGITNEQLLQALQESYLVVKYKSFIENILSTDDFMLFKKMMIRKNK